MRGLVFLSIIIAMLNNGCNRLDHEIKHAASCLVDSFTLQDVSDPYNLLDLQFYDDSTLLSLHRLQYALHTFKKNSGTSDYCFQKESTADISSESPCGFGTDRQQQRLIVLGYDRHLYVMDTDFYLRNNYDLNPSLKELGYDSVSKPWIRRWSPLIIEDSVLIVNIELSNSDSRSSPKKNSRLKILFSKGYERLIAVQDFYQKPVALDGTYYLLEMYDQSEKEMLTVYPALDSLYVTNLSTNNTKAIPLNNPFYKKSEAWDWKNVSPQQSHQTISRYWNENFLYTGIFHLQNHHTLVFFNWPQAQSSSSRELLKSSLMGVLVLDENYKTNAIYQFDKIYDDIMLALKMSDGIALPLKVDQNNYNHKTTYHYYRF